MTRVLVEHFEDIKKYPKNMQVNPKPICTKCLGLLNDRKELELKRYNPKNLMRRTK